MAAPQQQKPGTLVLKNVRLSFPQIFKAKAFKPTDEPTFSACFILNKVTDEAQITEIRKQMTAVAAGKWGTNIPKGLKLCLRKGDEDGKDGVDGYGPDVMFISANSYKPFPVVDRNPNVLLTERDNKPYAGCFVNVRVRFWAQDNDYGKRVNAQIETIQFAKDGEAFGDGPVNATEVFENLDDGTGSSGGGDEGGGLLG
jgi:hypothetical protein